MGFWSWLWKLFRGWFSGDTRESEEKRELGIERQDLKLTKKQLKMERDEKKKLKEVMTKLLEVEKLVKEGVIPNTQSQMGNQRITLEQCLITLLRSIDGLVRNKVSIRSEMTILNNFKSYWIVTRNCLGMAISQLSLSRNSGINKIAGKINDHIHQIGRLFNEISQDLVIEERISEEKMRDVFRQYNLIMQEEGSNRGGTQRNAQAQQLRPAMAR